MLFAHPISRRHLLINAMAGGASLLVASPIAGFAAEDPADNAAALINQLRRQHGVPPLLPEAKLQQAAIHQAGLMAKYRKIGHSLGWGNGFGGRLRQAGIRGPAAENVASGQKDVADVLTAWLNSAGHRKNLLDPLFTRYGLAYASAPQKPAYLYWAMLYGIEPYE